MLELYHLLHWELWIVSTDAIVYEYFYQSISFWDCRVSVVHLCTIRNYVTLTTDCTRMKFFPWMILSEVNLFILAPCNWSYCPWLPPPQKKTKKTSGLGRHLHFPSLVSTFCPKPKTKSFQCAHYYTCGRCLVIHFIKINLICLESSIATKDFFLKNGENFFCLSNCFFQNTLTQTDSFVMLCWIYISWYWKEIKKNRGRLGWGVLFFLCCSSMCHELLTLFALCVKLCMNMS